MVGVDTFGPSEGKISVVTSVADQQRAIGARAPGPRASGGLQILNKQLFRT